MLGLFDKVILKNKLLLPPGTGDGCGQSCWFFISFSILWILGISTSCAWLWLWTFRFSRIQNDHPKTDPFSGLYLGAFGPHGPELLLLRRSHWEDGEECVQGIKLTGDPNVPAGEVSFRYVQDHFSLNTLNSCSSSWDMHRAISLFTSQSTLAKTSSSCVLQCKSGRASCNALVRFLELSVMYDVYGVSFAISRL